MAESNVKLDCLHTPFLRGQAYRSSLQLNYLETLSKKFLYKFAIVTSIYNLSIMIWEVIQPLRKDLGNCIGALPFGLEFFLCLSIDDNRPPYY